MEDQESLASVLKENLEEGGFKVLTAVDGFSGLKLALDSHPDLILLDIAMPKMSGLELLRTLRENEWGKTVKVVILTNVANPLTQTEAHDLQVQDYIIKSNWSLKKLMDLVKKL